MQEKPTLIVTFNGCGKSTLENKYPSLFLDCDFTCSFSMKSYLKDKLSNILKNILLDTNKIGLQNLSKVLEFNLKPEDFNIIYVLILPEPSELRRRLKTCLERDILNGRGNSVKYWTNVFMTYSKLLEKLKTNYLNAEIHYLKSDEFLENWIRQNTDFLKGY